MHRLARDGIAFVGQLVPCFEEGDVALFMVGEIDVRCHLIPISETSKRPIEDVAEELAEGFISKLTLLQRDQPQIKVVVAQPPFPTDRRPNVELPFRGSIAERVHLHSLLSDSLDRLCRTSGMHFLCMPLKYKDKNGVLRRKYSDDGVHIMPCEGEAVIEALGKLTSKKLFFKRKLLTVIKRRWNYAWGGTLRRQGLPEITPVDLPK